MIKGTSPPAVMVRKRKALECVVGPKSALKKRGGGRKRKMATQKGKAAQGRYSNPNIRSGAPLAAKNAGKEDTGVCAKMARICIRQAARSPAICGGETKKADESEKMQTDCCNSGLQTKRLSKGPAQAHHNEDGNQME